MNVKPTKEIKMSEDNKSEYVVGNVRPVSNVGIRPLTECEFIIPDDTTISEIVVDDSAGDITWTTLLKLLSDVEKSVTDPLKVELQFDSIEKLDTFLKLIDELK